MSGISLQMISQHRRSLAVAANVCALDTNVCSVIKMPWSFCARTSPMSYYPLCLLDHVFSYLKVLLIHLKGFMVSHKYSMWLYIVKLMFVRARGSCVPRSAYGYRCTDMLLHGGGVRGRVQRRLSGPYVCPCYPGEGQSRAVRSPRAYLHPRGLLTMPKFGVPTTRLIVIVRQKVRCSLLPPPWPEDDTP